MAFNTSVFQGVYRLWYGPDLVHIHGRRERRALMLGSLGMFGMGLVWGLYFSSLGNWPLVAMDMVLMLGGLSAGLLIWRKQVHRAAVVLFSVLLSVLCVISWVFDAGTPQSPRTTHLYLLPLSVAALLVFRESGVWLRHGVSAACLVAVGILSVSHGSPLPQYALPETVRAAGAWVQVVAALGLLYGMLNVMQNDAAVRSVLEDELRQALEEHQFEMYYQPQVDGQGQVIAAEALIRWQHPQRGMIFPGKFVDVAEQTGLIRPMGHWALQQACAQLRKWSEYAACKHLRLAVNISQVQFQQQDFVAQVLNLIDRYGIDASLLELEVTESMLVQDMPDIIQKMSAIRARGVTFSLDDFGTGYSSLSYLKKLPLHQLKIDQSFVRDVLTDANDASIARTVVALGHDLGLVVVAEGVESEAQHAFLKSCGCDLFQGYLFSQALSGAAFLAYVQARAEAPELAVCA